MNYKIQIDARVKKDLVKIDRKWQIKILQTIKTTLMSNPQKGRKLAGILSKYRRLRVGSYCIIYHILDKKLIVEVIKIKHRLNVYKARA